MHKKKLGVKGIVIQGQTREIINNVRKFMCEEADNGIKIPLDKYRQRVLAATGVSRSTYQSILQQSRKIETGESTSFTTPSKQRSRVSRVLGEVSVEEIEAIRRLIFDFYVVENRRPTLKCILQKMKEAQISFSGEKTSLWRLLKKIGFSWKRTEDNHKILVETYDIRMKRIEFLQKIQQYRSENRSIIYTDETYVSSHTQSKESEGGKCFRKKVAKGARRLVVVHAGGENGFVPNGLLIFKSGAKSGDYQDDMNHANFMKWVHNQLLPNIPEHSVLVVDNASYHNVSSQPSISSTVCKNDMVSWLRERDVPCRESMTKPELYKLIKEKKSGQDPRYKLDDILEKHGHDVLRLPPNHPELNPMEKVWIVVKNWVGTHNVTCKLDDVEKLTRKMLNTIGPEYWKTTCDEVKSYETELLEKEHLIDNAFDTIQFTGNTDSSDESSYCPSDDENTGTEFNSAIQTANNGNSNKVNEDSDEDSDSVSNHYLHQSNVNVKRANHIEHIELNPETTMEYYEESTPAIKEEPVDFNSTGEKNIQYVNVKSDWE